MRKNKPKTKSRSPLLAKAAPLRVSQDHASSQEPAKELGFILTQEDERILKEFCDCVPEIEEISLDCWSESQSRLDLVIPCFVSEQEAKTGIIKQIFYSRTVGAKDSPQSMKSKIKTTCEIVIEAGTLPGTKIVKEGLGDCLGNRSGNLIVTICYK